jgi:nucleoside-diphosphate-sugar epimerase
MSSKPLALVIGATGSIGGALAAALLAQGWQVRGLNRSSSRPDRPDLKGIEWITGDAMNPADILAAAEGAQIIFQGANPPGYANWAKFQPGMMESCIAAAKVTGARVVLPGNVYNYGPDAWPRVTEASPQNPQTRKGAIRVALETRLADASSVGVRSLVVRAGDFFGPESGSSWLTEGWVAKGKPLKSVTLPGPAHAVHTWAYLPDFAQSIARLITMEADLPAVAVFNHGGHQLTGFDLAQALDRVAGRKLARRNLPWFAFSLAAPFVELVREMLEMRYLWEADLLLENAKLVAALGEEPHTPLDEALRTTLMGQGCLGPALVKAA